MATLTSHMETFALVSLEKQDKFARTVGRTIGQLELDAGIIRFPELELPFQVLGTESENTLTWLWAWADEQTEVPESLLKSSLEMRMWGQKEGISECTVPSVDLNAADGTVISLVASGVCTASCYYHEVYQGGGLFLLLFSDAIDRQSGFTVASLSKSFSDLASVHEFNHRTAFRSYFERKQIPFTEHDTFIVSEMETGEDIRVNFSRSGQLISINGKTVLA